MTTTTSHHPVFTNVIAEMSEAMGVHSDDRVEELPAQDPARFEAERPAESKEPGAAASAIPVVVSVAILFGFAIALAFGGRTLLDSVMTLLGN